MIDTLYLWTAAGRHHTIRAHGLHVPPRIAAATDAGQAWTAADIDPTTDMWWDLWLLRPGPGDQLTVRTDGAHLDTVWIANTLTAARLLWMGRRHASGWPFAYHGIDP